MLTKDLSLKAEAHSRKLPPFELSRGGNNELGNEPL